MFRLFGIQLEVHVTFGLLLAVFGYNGWQDAGALGALWAVVFVILMFACVVLHELGHSLTARRFGIGVRRILLLPIGGMAQFDAIPRQPRRELAIAVAGPAVNYVIAGSLIAIFGWRCALDSNGAPNSMQEVPGALILANLVMGIFNLLPAFPMDGGRILRALLAIRFDYLKATRWAARTGQTIAGLLCLGAIWFSLKTGENFWLLAILFGFIFYGAEMEYQMVRRTQQYAGLTVGDLTRRDYLTLPPEAPLSAARALLQQNQPQDILLVVNSVPLAILPRERLVSTGEQHDSDPALMHAEHHFIQLQAAWPLDTLAADLRRTRQTLFPVFSIGQFTGVLDVHHLDETVRILRGGGPNR